MPKSYNQPKIISWPIDRRQSELIAQAKGYVCLPLEPEPAHDRHPWCKRSFFPSAPFYEAPIPIAEQPTLEQADREVRQQMEREGWRTPSPEESRANNWSESTRQWYASFEKRSSAAMKNPLKLPRPSRVDELEQVPPGLDEREIWAALHWLNADFVADVAATRKAIKEGTPVNIEKLRRSWPCIVKPTSRNAKSRLRKALGKILVDEIYMNDFPEFWQMPDELLGEFILPPKGVQLNRDVFGKTLLAAWHSIVNQNFERTNHMADGCPPTEIATGSNAKKDSDRMGDPEMTAWKKLNYIFELVNSFGPCE